MLLLLWLYINNYIYNYISIYMDIYGDIWFSMMMWVCVLQNGGSWWILISSRRSFIVNLAHLPFGIYWPRTFLRVLHSWDCWGPREVQVEPVVHRQGPCAAVWICTSKWALGCHRFSGFILAPEEFSRSGPMQPCQSRCIYAVGKCRELMRGYKGGP